MSLDSFLQVSASNYKQLTALIIFVGKEWQNIKKSMRVGLELKLKQQVISVFKH